MSTRAVDPFTISMEISALGMRLGALEGQARERGYPLLPDSRLVDCNKLVLSVFDKHRELVGQMRTELDVIYSKLRHVSTEFEGISVPELKEVFEGQIKLLHEKRGVLTHSLNAFDSLLSSHVLIVELEKRVISVHDQVTLFKTEKIGIDSWELVNNAIEDLLLRLRIVFPDSKKGTENFCKTHYECKQEMLQALRECRLDLDLKKCELLERSRLECNATLEVLLPALQKMRKGQIDDRAIENIQKLFGALPLDLRTLLFAARSILPEDQIENTIIYQTPPDRGASPDTWAEVRGLSYYDSERDLNKYESSVNEILGRCGEQRKVVVSERDLARESLNQFVAQLPKDEIRNPKFLLEAFGRICSQHPSYISPAAAMLLQACLVDEPEEVSTDALSLENPQEVFESRLRNIPVLKSLQKMKEQIKAYKGAKKCDDAQRERLVAALLDAAENKGGVSLNVDKGVYYWIWFLAHEKDPSAGGDNFGKNNAPKDLDRLILAIEKSMPPEEAPAKVVSPVEVKVESVPTLATPPARQAASTRRSLTAEPYKSTVPSERKSSPRPVTRSAPKPSPSEGMSVPQRALKPSEVVRRERSLSNAAVVPKEIRIVSIPNTNPAPVPVPVMTEIKVKCRVPEGHSLNIRGQGGDLNWNVGKKLMKVDEETYVHKMEGATGKIEYKIVLDDSQFEGGANRVIEAQKSQEIVPVLQMPKVAVVINFAPKDNKLFICGTGPGMSWDQGKKVELKHVNGKFLLESKAEMGNLEFKILLSNNQWSKGANFKAENGKTIEITPEF